MEKRAGIGGKRAWFARVMPLWFLPWSPMGWLWAAFSAVGCGLIGWHADQLDKAGHPDARDWWIGLTIFAIFCVSVMITKSRKP